MLFGGEHQLLIAARRGPPLAIGYGNGEMFIASDAIALASLTSRVAYLHDGDWAVVTTDHATIYDAQDQIIDRVAEVIRSGIRIAHRKPMIDCLYFTVTSRRLSM